MNNIINNWSYDKPTEPGDYLVCYGDVDTPMNVQYVCFSAVSGGKLIDGGANEVKDYSDSYKFARLVYSPTEIKEIEDGQ